MVHSPDSFDAFVAERGLPALTRGPTRTLQVNVGKLCNQACHHCHVEAGPRRTEVMEGPTVERLLALLARSPGVRLVDVTGGAPEMNPHFRELVAGARALDRDVTVRSNLTVLTLPGFESMVSFFAEHAVGVIASLPCYTADNVDRQRGRGVFDASIEALRRLNAAGYGQGDPARSLDLVFNPLGPSLPPAQGDLEAAYQRELHEHFGITFDRLLTITNMPIKRFAEQLEREGATEAYQELLVASFESGNLDRVMCRDLLSVGWTGELYDCDFNQMLDLPLPGPRTIWDLETLDDPRGQGIATAPHCFGCTAGAGSSCGGALT